MKKTAKQKRSEKKINRRTRANHVLAKHVIAKHVIAKHVIAKHVIAKHVIAKHVIAKHVLAKRKTAKNIKKHITRRHTVKQHGGLPGVQIIAPILRAALNHASKKAEILIPILKDIIPLVEAVIADDAETLANQQIAKELEEPFKKTFENYLSVKNTFTQTANRDVDDYIRSKMGSQTDTAKANAQLNKLTKTIFQNDEFRQRILYENLSDILSDADSSNTKLNQAEFQSFVDNVTLDLANIGKDFKWKKKSTENKEEWWNVKFREPSAPHEIGKANKKKREEEEAEKKRELQKAVDEIIQLLKIINDADPATLLAAHKSAVADKKKIELMFQEIAQKVTTNDFKAPSYNPDLAADVITKELQVEAANISAAEEPSVAAQMAEDKVNELAMVQKSLEKVKSNRKKLSQELKSINSALKNSSIPDEDLQVQKEEVVKQLASVEANVRDKTEQIQSLVPQINELRSTAAIEANDIKKMRSREVKEQQNTFTGNPVMLPLTKSKENDKKQIVAKRTYKSFVPQQRNIFNYNYLQNNSSKYFPTEKEEQEIFGRFNNSPRSTESLRSPRSTESLQSPFMRRERRNAQHDFSPLRQRRNAYAEFEAYHDNE
jgi:hypothetical protein